MKTQALAGMAWMALSGVALAEEPRPAVPVAPSQVRAAPGVEAGRGGAPGAARVRSSHTVDVIAPGESVETVLDRMRARGPESGGRAGPGDRPEVRGAGVRGPDGGGPGGRGKDGRGRPGEGRGGGPGPGGRDGRGDNGPPHRR
jgi:hypothetical protein